MLMSVVNPKYFIPIGGTIRHMRAYKDLAEAQGRKSDSVFELLQGEVVEFTGGHAQRLGRVESKNILVDGLGIGDVGHHVLRDRKRLSQDGVAIVLMTIDKSLNRLVSTPEVISRGFVFEKQEKDLLESAGASLFKEIAAKKRVDKIALKTIAADFLEKFFWKSIGRRPMILPVVVEV